jgi:hypothetical protein
MIPPNGGPTLDLCPVCGSAASLWQYSTSETAPRKLLVCCTNGEPIGPQDGLVGEGCLLYLPPNNFYRETIRDAVRYWNEFAKALTALRASHEAGVMASQPMCENVPTIRCVCNNGLNCPNRTPGVGVGGATKENDRA